MTIEIQSGAVQAEVLPDGSVRLEMPLRPIPPKSVSLELDGRSLGGYLVDAGVPHLVVFVRDISKTPVESLGRRLRSHPSLGAEGANVDFVGTAEPGGSIPVRTFERGVEGETMACGTGAAAVAWLLHHTGTRPARVSLRMRSGKVMEAEIRREEGRPPALSIAGDAVLIYQGRLSDEAIEEALRC
jgi:diaminopimelate epimerase